MISSRHSELHVVLLSLLLLYLCTTTIHTSASSSNNSTAGRTTTECFPADADALLKLKRSFVNENLTSWQAGTDCCRWEAVECDVASGRVIRLGLRDLHSRGLHPALFNLTSLRYLSLANHDFMGSSLPSAGFERLTEMVDLELKESIGLFGQIPIGIAWLSKLETLDLESDIFSLFLEKPNFQTFIANLSSLTDLYLDSVDLTSNGETWSVALANSTPRLQSLSLINCGLYGSIHHSFSRLSSLRDYLSLSYNIISGKVPEFFANFSLLSTLDLSFNDFKGEFPSKIFHLQDLSRLYLSGNSRLSGHLQSFPLGSGLEVLDLMDTNISDSIPPSIVNLKNLQSLTLMTEGTSKILSLIGNLPSLYTLELHGLSGLEKPQFSWIGQLRHLTGLTIWNYNFSEPLPSWIGNLTKLIQLSLDTCNFNGPIPPWIGNLTQLSSITLSNSYPPGRVELSSFLKLNKLSELDVSNNVLSEIDTGDSLFSPLPNIDTLVLASCGLTKLPSVLKHMTEITELDLSSNQIKGAIPSWIWENWNDKLTELNLSNNMFTSLETFPSLLPMARLDTLDISYNRLEGDVPIPVNWSGTILDYSNNYFNSIPSDFGRYLGTTTLYLDLSNNTMSGHIPTSICSASELEILDLSYNNFSGEIPSCLAKSNLRMLKLRGNRVHGVLPDNIREGCMLEIVDLSRNYISGKLPRSLSKCFYLTFLDVSDNQIADSFPSWLGILPRLRVLVLSSNKFSGLIMDLEEDDQTMKSFSSVQVIDFASNRFSGNLPQKWFHKLKSMMLNGNDEDQVVGHQQNFFGPISVSITIKGHGVIFTKILNTFSTIDLSNNSFWGSIPESIGRLVSLHGLNMSCNNFTGQIPPQLSNLTKLESMDLSRNHLTGEIPQELTSLTSLEWLNLSYNNLTGRIPQENQFLSFPNSSFEGNPGLCGRQVSKQCNNSGPTTARASDQYEANGFWSDRLDTIVLFTFVGLGFGVGFALAMMFDRFCHIEGWVYKRYGTHT